MLNTVINCLFLGLAALSVVALVGGACYVVAYLIKDTLRETKQ